MQGDYIIKGSRGLLGICKPDIFDKYASGVLTSGLSSRICN